MRVAPAGIAKRRPYGLAFMIEDLAHMRRWADERGLVMLVTLDRVINGAEFEEMIVLSPRGRTDRRMLLWRSFGTIYAQPPNAKPRGFTTVPQALDWLAPPQPPARHKHWLLRWSSPRNPAAA